jgi:hypothetical protein
VAVEKGSRFVGRDVYIDYSYMRVMFRWEFESEQIFVRHYGKPESSTPIAHDNGLFNEATLYGTEISRDEYFQGK